MLPTLYESFTFAADIIVILFAVYFIFHIRKRENELEKKEKAMDTAYHHTIDEALEKERQILVDATSEADKILLDADLTTQDTQEKLQKSLQEMTMHMQKKSMDTAVRFLESYSDNLQKIMASSLGDFQTITKSLEGDMQKQVQEFRESLLPNLEKELEQYKAMRMKQSEQVITQIIQTVSQQVLNKSLSMEDHQKLLIEALEKAKSQGVFT